MTSTPSSLGPPSALADDEVRRLLWAISDAQYNMGRLRELGLSGEAAVQMDARNEKIAAVLAAFTAQVEQAEEARSKRDTDWVLAFAKAIGTDSRLRAPLVPEPKVIKECLDLYAEARVAVVRSPQ